MYQPRIPIVSNNQLQSGLCVPIGSDHTCLVDGTAYLLLIVVHFGFYNNHLIVWQSRSITRHTITLLCIQIKNRNGWTQTKHCTDKRQSTFRPQTSTWASIIVSIGIVRVIMGAHGTGDSIRPKRGRAANFLIYKKSYKNVAPFHNIFWL